MMVSMKTIKERKKRMTLDKLAIMIQEGFMATAKDLIALTERVTLVEERLNAHDKEFNNMHGKMDAIFLELKEIRKEIKEADTRGDVADLQIRVSKLEKKVKL
jgi:hypothetical protein